MAMPSSLGKPTMQVITDSSLGIVVVTRCHSHRGLGLLVSSNCWMRLGFRVPLLPRGMLCGNATTLGFQYLGFVFPLGLNLLVV